MLGGGRLGRGRFGDTFRRRAKEQVGDRHGQGARQGLEELGRRMGYAPHLHLADVDLCDRGCLGVSVLISGGGGLSKLLLGETPVLPPLAEDDTNGNGKVDWVGHQEPV